MNRFGRWIPVAAVLALSTLASAGDANAPRGKLRIRSFNRPRIFPADPVVVSNAAEGSEVSLLHDGLYGYDYLKRPLTVIPRLAADLPTVSEDGTVYTIPLRKGVKFTRNACFGGGAKNPTTREVTAHDVLLAFKRIGDAHTRSRLGWVLLGDRIRGFRDFRHRTERYKPGDFSRFDIERISGIRVVDEHKLKITLNRPCGTFVHRLAMPYTAPIPREAIGYWLAQTSDGKAGRVALNVEERRPHFGSFEHLPTTGPFRLQTLTDEGNQSNLGWTPHEPDTPRARSWVLTPNSNFQHARYPTRGERGDRSAGLLAPAGKPLPRVATLKLTDVQFWSKDNSTVLADTRKSFLNGECDVLISTPEAIKPMLTEKGTLKSEHLKKGIRLMNRVVPTTHYVGLSFQSSLLRASRSLRQAISLALNRKLIARELHNGAAIPARHIIPPNVAGVSAVRGKPLTTFDPNAARAKLKQARKELAAAGLLDDGKIPELTLLSISFDEHSTKMEEKVYVRQLAEVGIRTRLRTGTWEEMRGRLARGNGDMYLLGWLADSLTAEDFLQLWTTEMIAKDENHSHYSNPTYDRLFGQLTVERNPKKRTELIRKLSAILKKDCPAVPTTHPIEQILLGPRVGPIKPHPMGIATSRYWSVKRDADSE